MAARVLRYFCILSFLMVGRRMTRGASSRFAILVAQGLEGGAKFLREDFRLFPCREMAALLGLVVVDEIRIRPNRPTFGSLKQLVRKGAHSDRDSDVLRREIVQFVLPVETRTGDGGLRQPGDGNVIENVVSGEASGLSVKNLSNQFQATPLEVEEERR